MYIEDVVQRIKGACRDASREIPVDRCIEVLNNAIQQVSSLLIATNCGYIIKSVDLHDGDKLPNNFMKAAGTYPIRITEGKVEVLDDTPKVRFRYFATPAKISTTKDEMPFEHDSINEIIVRSAILLALNENEYSIAQDSQLLAALQQAVAEGMK